jgi:hypothetical protein
MVGTPALIGAGIGLFLQLYINAAGLTLVHFSAQLEPCLTQKNTLHTLNIP